MNPAHKVSPLLGESYAIEELRDFIVGVSMLTEPVLLTGEAGTGKGLAASKIHAVGRSAFIPQARVEIPRFNESELDVLLFGDHDSPGMVAAAAGNTTCYLSGIEFLTPRLTRRLCGFLLDPTASEDGTPRLILGSRIDLNDLRDGRLLDPEFLAVVSRYHMRIPPLHERVEDIPILCNYQIWLHSEEDDYEHRWVDFREQVLPDLLTYPWPGNIAELNEVVQTYCGLAEVERGMPAHQVHTQSIDVQYLREALAGAYQQFLDLLELERITGRGDLVIPTNHRGMHRDELN